MFYRLPFSICIFKWKLLALKARKSSKTRGRPCRQVLSEYKAKQGGEETLLGPIQSAW